MCIATDTVSYETKMERYMLLLKSRSCTPFWRNWIIRKIDEMQVARINQQITYLMNPSELVRFNLENN